MSALRLSLGLACSKKHNQSTCPDQVLSVTEGRHRICTLTPALTITLRLNPAHVPQAAIHFTEEQRLEVAELTRTMIAQLSALSQRHRVLDDDEEEETVTSPLAARGEGVVNVPATSDHEPCSPALSRCSPKLAALRVRAQSGVSLECNCHNAVPAAGRRLCSFRLVSTEAPDDPGLRTWRVNVL